MTDGGAQRVLGCAAPTLEGPARAPGRGDDRHPGARPVKGHRRGELVLIVDNDLTSELEV